MSASKRRGTKAEVAVRDYLRANGWLHAERLPTEGAKDRGDITGVDPELVIEVKACARMELGAWLDEADTEATNAEASVAVVWHKRRGKANPAEWYVTMSGEDFVRILAAWCGLERAA